MQCESVSCLVVDVVGAEAAYDHADEGGADRDSLKVAFRVVIGPFSPRVTRVASAS